MGQGRRQAPPHRTGARRGVPLLGRFLRSGHWLSHTGAPMRWQGGRKARMDETLAQRFRSAVGTLGYQRKSSVSVMPHLCSVPNANAEPKRALDLGKIRGHCGHPGFQKVPSLSLAFALQGVSLSARPRELTTALHWSPSERLFALDDVPRGGVMIRMSNAGSSDVGSLHRYR